MAIIILFVSLCKNKHRPVTLTSNGTCEKARHRSLSLPPAWLIQVGISGKPGQECGKAPEHMVRPQHSRGEAASARSRSYQTSLISHWGYSVTPQTEDFLKCPQLLCAWEGVWTRQPTRLWYRHLLAH